MSTTTCLGCGAKLVGALCSDCEHKAAQIIQQSHWPLETSLSPHALAHVEAAIELYLDNDRTQGVEPQAVELELTNLANNIRAHLQHVVYAHGRDAELTFSAGRTGRWPAEPARGEAPPLQADCPQCGVTPTELGDCMCPDEPTDEDLLS